jgi:hypothetical protein
MSMEEKKAIIIDKKHAIDVGSGNVKNLLL